MVDHNGNWTTDDDDLPLYNISRTLRNQFGDNFEKLCIEQKLGLLAAICGTARVGGNFNDFMDDADLYDYANFADLHTPEFFEDTQEAESLIKILSASIVGDESFHELPIGNADSD
jgi:hypothetical protein